MVSNPGYYSQMATAGSLTQIEDGVDNPHTGLIKALSLGVAGNYVISGFDASSVTATTVTIAAGVVLRDGERVEISGSGITLSATYTTGYHLLVARSSALAVINPTAADKVPAFTAGDVPIAILAHTGSNPMRIQYFGTGKTKNSLSLAYSNSGTYTEMSKVTAASGGTTVEVATAGGDFTIDNTDADKKIIMRLGSDDANTDFEVRNNSDAVKFGVDGAGTTTIAGTVNLGSVVNAGTDTDKFLVLDSGGNVDFRTGTEVVSDIGALTAEADTLHSVTVRGSSTTNDVTVGSLSSGAYILGDASVEAGPTMGVNDLYYFINAASVVLPTAASCAQRLLFLKNIYSSACTITLTGSEVFDGIPSASTGINPNPDQRVVAASPAQTLTLEVGESVILVGMTDTVSPLITGYYVLSLDTQTGISNVVEDTSPQLGGNLDVNGNSIVSTSNGDINITPDGSGKIVLDGLNWPTADGSADQVLKTDGAGQLSFVAQSGGDVVDDTTPQLGGDLDTNSNDITGDFALTGAVQMKKAVISTGNVSPAASAADSGKYFYRASSETSNFTLPADSYVGEQYVLINNSGSSITIASTGGDTIVGSTSVPDESAVTIIAVAANTWFVVG